MNNKNFTLLDVIRKTDKNIRKILHPKPKDKIKDKNKQLEIKSIPIINNKID